MMTVIKYIVLNINAPIMIQYVVTGLIETFTFIYFITLYFGEPSLKITKQSE